MGLQRVRHDWATELNWPKLWFSWWRILLQCRRPGFCPWVRKVPWRRERLPTPVFLSFLCDSAGKESTCYVGDLGLIHGLGRSPGEGKGYPLQYSGLENSMDYTVHGVTKSRTWLSDFHFSLPKYDNNKIIIILYFTVIKVMNVVFSKIFYYTNMMHFHLN